MRSGQSSCQDHPSRGVRISTSAASYKKIDRRPWRICRTIVLGLGFAICEIHFQDSSTPLKYRTLTKKEHVLAGGGGYGPVLFEIKLNHVPLVDRE